MEPQPPRTALIVFAKRPVAGRVKTRLTPTLSPAEAAQLYRAFLLDALDQYRELDVDIRLYLASVSDGSNAAPVDASVDTFAQVGDDLAARMHHAFDATFAAGYRRVLIIGTDHPTLPSSFIEQGLTVLEAAPAICLGPSIDGGYYLLGMNTFYPELFAEMEYSHGHVFRDTLTRAAATGASLTVLPPWYDVDEPGDLDRLLGDLADGPERAPHTHAILEELGRERLRAS